jgi:hypothetical protein
VKDISTANQLESEKEDKELLEQPNAEALLRKSNAEPSTEEHNPHATSTAEYIMPTASDLFTGAGGGLAGAVDA